jgi:hypothetical protein
MEIAPGATTPKPCFLIFVMELRLLFSRSFFFHITQVAPGDAIGHRIRSSPFHVFLDGFKFQLFSV